MVEVDTGIDDADQNAFALGPQRIGSGSAIPNRTRANPCRTSIGVVGVVLIFEDSANAWHALKVFSFFCAQLNRNRIEDHVINVADFDSSAQKPLSLRENRLAVDSERVQIVLTLNAVDGRAAFGSGKRCAFKHHDVARDFRLIDDLVHINSVEFFDRGIPGWHQITAPR